MHERRLRREFGVAQRESELGDRRRPVPVRGGLERRLDRRGVLTRRGVAARFLPAYPEGQEFVAAVRRGADVLERQHARYRRFLDRVRSVRRDELVERRDLLPQPDRTGFLAVVAEVSIGHVAQLVPDQAVGEDLFGVELDLELHVPRQSVHVAGEAVDEDPLRLALAVDVEAVAVAFVGEHLELVVLVVAHAAPHGGEVDAGVAFRLDHFDELGFAGSSDVEVAVGDEHDAV